MRLIPLRQAQTSLMNAPKNKNLKSMELLTFKKDRGLKIERRNDGLFLVESGYLVQEVDLDKESAPKKILKDAFKREFPRSNQVYFNKETL